MKICSLVISALILVSCTTSLKTDVGVLKPASLSRIGIRKVASGWEFFDKNSGRRFYVQGVNWVQLSDSKVKWPPNISFNEDYYSKHQSQVEASLLEMGRLGYNVVRVRLDADSISGPSDKPILNGRYISNIIDFIRRANSQGLYVELTGQWLPKNYYQLAYTKNFPLPNKNSSGLNLLLLSDGLVSAFGHYEADLINAIKEQAPELLTGIFAFDLWNELYFDGNEKPFSEASGLFVSDLGESYDLGNKKSRQALADSAALNWVNTVAASIKEVDSDMLLTSSIFTPREVQRLGYEGVYTSDSKNSDPRQPFRMSILNGSKLDFLEIHPYPHILNYALESDLKSLEYMEFEKTKPVLAGEFGAFKKDFKKTRDAIGVARSFISQVCRNHLAGWLYWTWDTAEQPYLWNMKENDGAIANAIAPKSYTTCE